MVKRIVVIGAGIGGLSAAAMLAKAGLDVIVLEAHVYPGGCAGSFYHQGFRFDAGATLAGGFYPGGPMDLVSRYTGIKEWPVTQIDPAMVVHLPGGEQVQRFSDQRKDEEYRRVFGQPAMKFWHWQEKTADALWDLAMRLPDWPPQTLGQGINVLNIGIAWLGRDIYHRLNPRLVRDAFRPVAHHLRGTPDSLRVFVDAQLLISAQTTSQSANALYGASALDLPRRGVVHVEGGIGVLASSFVKAIRDHGGKVLFRKEVTRIRQQNGQVFTVETKRGEIFPADLLIANLTAIDINRLLAGNNPAVEEPVPPPSAKGWGAFMLYLGVKAEAIPPGMPLHHQVVVQEPLGEGNSVFISISPEWDDQLAPQEHRTVSISTHTHLGKWWHLLYNDPSGYEQTKQKYTERLVKLASNVLPGLPGAIELTLPATPVTFQRFTRRSWGWVGGFPQESLFQYQGPRIVPGIWMVGDSIFPGQSIPAVSLGGLRVAQDILAWIG